jgi:hypothetical protein
MNFLTQIMIWAQLQSLEAAIRSLPPGPWTEQLEALARAFLTILRAYGWPI